MTDEERASRETTINEIKNPSTMYADYVMLKAYQYLFVGDPPAQDEFFEMLKAGLGDEQKAIEYVNRVKEFYDTVQSFAAPTTENGVIVPRITISDIMDAMMPIADVVEKEAQWLVPELIPKGKITLLAGDGDEGKSTLYATLAAGVSTGDCRNNLFFSDVPDDFLDGKPEKVLIFTTENDASEVLRPRLRKNNANLQLILIPRIKTRKDKAGRKKAKDFEVNSELVEMLIKYHQPALVVFDPIQSFVPESVNMASRNQMRHTFDPLGQVAEETGAAILLVCHTNKKIGVAGRKRVADSADLYDLARSVMVVGDTGQKNGDNPIRYLSHEKHNNSKGIKTILYTVDGTKAYYMGRSEKSDADFVKDQLARSAPAKRDAEELIIEALTEAGGKMKTADLDALIKSKGITGATLRRAKESLKAAERIFYEKPGYGEKQEWFVSMKRI